ncbi:uncharacterized protein LOC131682641 [Topomyia yanbarensis]|uniref:uncharacterized protein LOC131682641 n=1 Tax=Topomyia yanbarensis TaxID=2498891 RepID=UPI00273BC78A|nr:uncharacterized protein LOC131682641 [Topomyia yanbarensis]
MSTYAAQMICPCCSDTTGTGQTCKECGQLCCTSCSQEPSERVSLFTAPFVLCSRCFRQRSETEETNKCELHPDRSPNLYCLTCEKLICCDCFIMQADHKRHTIDSVEIVYRQKLLETVEKFREIPKQLKLIDRSVVRQVDENLKMIEEVEQQLLTDVHRLVQQQTSIILAQTEQKKRTLLHTKEVLDRTDLQQRKILEEIKGLNTNEFLHIQESLNRRCDMILKDVGQLRVEPIRWDDIQCDLIPACKLQTIVLNIPGDLVLEGKPVLIQLMDDYVIQWTVTFYLNPSTIGLEMYPNQVLDEFPFRTFVEISHPTTMKITGASFSFRESMDRSELVSIDKLKAGGYLSDEGDLKLRIGVRPENITDENRLVKMFLLEQRKRNDRLTVEVAVLKDQYVTLQADSSRVRSDSNLAKESYETLILNLKKEIAKLKQAAEKCPTTPSSLDSISFAPTDDAKQKLTLDMKRLQAKLETMKIAMKSMNPFAIGSFEIYRWSRETKFYSPHITSYNGITVYVIVQPNFANNSNPAVNAYICWAKGPKKRCEVFIEVINEYEEDCVREDRVFDFSKGTSFSWQSVITHYKLFREGGFLEDDNLTIQFGLRPLLE